MKKLILGLLASFVILPTICFGQEWVARYNGPTDGYDGANAIAVDASGNVYVTGSSQGSGTSDDYTTIKYNSLGVEQWVARYNHSNNGSVNDVDIAHAIAVDTSGNVYVTGKSIGGPGRWSWYWYDYATVKYDSLGVEQWVARYNGPGNQQDDAGAIAVDASGNVYVTGYTRGSPTHEDYATIKYNSSGVERWVRIYDGPGSNCCDLARGIVVNGGYVYVTGYSGDFFNYDYATIKYDTAGVGQWVRRYNGPDNGGDLAYAIAVDENGNVYVTGYSYDSGAYNDYATIKYDSLGVEQWVARYNGPDSSGDYAKAIAVDENGNVYVTGYNAVVGLADTSYDYATVKYDSLGIEQWVARYNGPGNSNDYAYAIAVDGEGDIYVTGYSEGVGTYNDYATIKYNSSGDIVWLRRYNGSSNGGDGARAIAVDGEGNVYVTGESWGSGTYCDYATIKYSCVGVEEHKPQVTSHKLQVEVYPNPIVGSGIISYELPDKLTTRNQQLVTLKVYDLGGRLVKTLVNEKVSAGCHKIELMGRYDKPCPYKKGIYFVQLKSGEFTATQKFIILE